MCRFVFTSICLAGSFTTQCIWDSIHPALSCCMTYDIPDVYLTIQSAAAAADAAPAPYRCLLQQLLLFVIVGRMRKLVAGSLILIPSSLCFLLRNTRFIFNGCAPWQNCHFYRLDLPILHPRHLRACAKPRRAAARRGEAPLLIIYKCDVTRKNRLDRSCQRCTR